MLLDWIVENKSVYFQGSRRPAVPNVTPSFSVYPFHSLLEPSTHHGANTTHHNWDIALISFLLSLCFCTSTDNHFSSGRAYHLREFCWEFIGSPTICPASSTWYETGTWGRCCPTTASGTDCVMWTSCSGHSIIFKSGGSTATWCPASFLVFLKHSLTVLT